MRHSLKGWFSGAAITSLVLFAALRPNVALAEGDPPPTAGTFMDGWTQSGNINVLQYGSFLGSDNVWKIESLGNQGDPTQAFRWYRSVTLPAGTVTLHMEVASEPGGPTPPATNEYDWLLFVQVNNDWLPVNQGQPGVAGEGNNSADYGAKVICTQGAWLNVDVDLSAYAGQTVDLRLYHCNGGLGWWHFEMGYWRAVTITGVGGGGGGGGGGTTAPPSPPSRPMPLLTPGKPQRSAWRPRAPGL